MSLDRRALSRRLRSLLQEHLAKGDEGTLEGAYELGRQALDGGVGILEMTTAHHEALRALLREAGAPANPMEILESAQALFVESLSPYEMTQMTFRETTAAWRRLNDRLEEEAQRIAHALHDESGQLLVMAHIALAELEEDLPPANRCRLQEARGLLDQMEEQLRRISHELRPTILDDLGLVPALEFLSEGVSKRSGLQIQVESEIDDRLAAGLETALYRVVQEALTNVSRHARARRVAVRLRQEGGEIVCAVRDDGIGFDTAQVMAPGARSGLGLIGMEERLSVLGGTLSVKAEPGCGTEIRVRVPMEVRHVPANLARG
jgi:signal transduction histidine kinase